MNKKSFRNSWKSHVDEKLEFKRNKFGMISGYPGIFHQIEENGGRFSSWNLLYMPEGAVEIDLDLFVAISCVYPEHQYAKQFLSWTNEAADRALSDIRFTLDPEGEREKGNSDPLAKRGWKIEGVFPGNHGKVVAAACLARALRDNSELDKASLLLAADEIAESALYGGEKMWDYVAQGEYLRCVRLCLVAGDVQRAQYFLKKTKRKFKDSFVHQHWLQSLCDAIEVAGGDPLENETVACFQNFFDEVRNPEVGILKGQDADGKAIYANISILRLELAIIKNIYILRLPAEKNWDHIVSLISE